MDMKSLKEESAPVVEGKVDKEVNKLSSKLLEKDDEIKRLKAQLAESKRVVAGKKEEVKNSVTLTGDFKKIPEEDIKTLELHERSSSILITSSHHGFKLHIP